MCVLLILLPALGGRLAPCPDEEINEFLVAGGPRRDVGDWDRVSWDDAPVWGLEASPSSETMSVMREELYIMVPDSSRGGSVRRPLESEERGFSGVAMVSFNF